MYEIMDENENCIQFSSVLISLNEYKDFNNCIDVNLRQQYFQHNKRLLNKTLF